MRRGSRSGDAVGYSATIKLAFNTSCWATMPVSSGELRFRSSARCEVPPRRREARVMALLTKFRALVSDHHKSRQEGISMYPTRFRLLSVPISVRLSELVSDQDVATGAS